MGSPQQFILGSKMKWTLCLFLVASVATALPTYDAKGRAFSLFSVVTFPNQECSTIMNPPMVGLCQTAEECSNAGGQASGNCASGFGVCCFKMIDEAGEVANNVTYIQNDGFPTTVGNVATVTAVNRAFTIRGHAGICQIRFDFDTAIFTEPTNGACTNDVITVTSPSAANIGINELCGTLSGQHIYIENDAVAPNPAATLNINTNDFQSPRSWKILVRMIECDNPNKAPNDCLQYHTGESGQITSLNGALVNDAQSMLNNLQYNICIRQEAGNTQIQFREARSAAGAAIDSFGLQGAAGALPATSLTGTDPLGAGPRDCEVSSITIQGATFCNQGVANACPPSFCGGVLNAATGMAVAGSVTADIAFGSNFEVTVFSDGDTDKAEATGFDLVYSQS